MNFPIELAVPFRIGPDGQVATVSDPNSIVRQHVLSVVGTQRGERVMRSNYGVNILRFLFAQNDDATNTLLRSEVAAALQAWEPDARFISVTINTDEMDPNIASIGVRFRNLTTNDSGQAVTVSVNAMGL